MTTHSAAKKRICLKDTRAIGVKDMRRTGVIERTPREMLHKILDGDSEFPPKRPTATFGEPKVEGLASDTVVLFTVNGSEIPLSLEAMAALSDIQVNPAEDLDALKRPPHRGWAGNKARIIEDELVMVGLVEVKRLNGKNICRLSEMAKQGEFEAVE
jgi:hypothetical protein